MMEMDDVSFLDAQLFLRFQRLQKLNLVVITLWA